MFQIESDQIKLVKFAAGQPHPVSRFTWQVTRWLGKFIKTQSIDPVNSQTREYYGPPPDAPCIWSLTWKETSNTTPTSSKGSTSLDPSPLTPCSQLCDLLSSTPCPGTSTYDNGCCQELPHRTEVGIGAHRPKDHWPPQPLPKAVKWVRYDAQLESFMNAYDKK